MKKIKNRENRNQKFTVAVNHINKSRALLPYILNDKMGEFAMNSIQKIKTENNATPKLYKIQMLKNAFLNDVLHLESQVLKLDTEELLLKVSVLKKVKNETDIICIAHYSLSMNSNNFEKAS